MPIRGVRGAVTVKENSREQILDATQKLLEEILERNPEMEPPEIASAIFSVTEDLNAAFPAKAARIIGWNMVPLFGAKEISAPDGIQMCIRVLIHWNTELPQEDIEHVYLGEAKKLRPDLDKNK
ncbi:MAG: chorismate mutase [Anaerolineales bacterium]|jgi:chorismate mutase